MNKQNSWIVEVKDAEKRLDVFLTEQLPTVSRSQIQKRIKRDLVLLNDAPTSVHTFLKQGDRIAMLEEAETERKSTTETEPAGLPELPDLNIIEETDGFLIIDKPVGILVHPDHKTKTGTVIDMLLKHDPSLAKIGEDPMRPAIVHRLDKDVSGLMLVAKTQQAYDYFKHLFKQRKIKKTYLAFVYGELPQNEGDIRFRIARSSTSARMAARPEQEEAGKAAWTHYRVIERFRGATLVEAQIISGRTHQIRAHFFALGCPVIGDPLYTAKHATRKIEAQRLMLQSVGLEFTDPITDEERSYTLAPDPSFDDLRTELS